MSKFLNNTALLFILACGAIALPNAVFASTVYIETDHQDFFVGDTIQFTVRMDSEQQEINAIEGEIILDDASHAAVLADLNTAGSLFSLWPDKPLPSEDNTSISFVGGSPGGFVSTDAIVLNMVLKFQQPGQITLFPNNIHVYLNDGKGTKDAVNVHALQINILPKTSDTQSVDDWSTIIADDTTAPEPFLVTLGRDAALFNNQYFVSFFTTDTESGVAYYEIQEGTSDFMRAESPYVLADQSLSSAITVKALDKAGNERMAKFTPTTPFNASLLYWIAGIFLIIVVIPLLVWKALKPKR